MNFAIVSRLLSTILLILGLAFAVCLGVSRILDDPSDAVLSRNGFLISIGISLTASWIFYYIGRKAPRKFFQKEALCVIGLGWILSSILGSVPYLVIAPEIGIANAIFESTSGLTTTGASVLSNLEELPPSLLFWRSLSQWIGGMGVVVFFVAILSFLGVGAKMLYANEASGAVADFEESRVQSTVLRLVYIYLGLSSACMLSYKIAGMNWFDAICHTFTTISTAGFSTRSGSIADFNSPMIEWVAIIFMILGGVSFLLILKIVNRRFNQLKANTEFIAYISLLAISTIVVTIMVYNEGIKGSILESIRPSAFQVTAIMTTTGYATEDYVQWGALPQVVLLMLMLIGGCSGSTAGGGTKVARLVVAFRMCLLSIERSFRSRIIRQIKMNNRTLDDEAASDIMYYLVLFVGVGLMSVVVTTIFEPYAQVDTNISAVVACLCNIGPGLAQVGPASNYEFLQPHTKFFLSLLMIMGRLELYAILALFSPSLWKRFK